MCILIHTLLNFVPKGGLENKSSLVHLMAWCHIDDKPPEPMMIQLTDAHMHRSDSMKFGFGFQIIY